MEFKFKNTFINYKNLIYHSILEKIYYNLKKKKIYNNLNPKVTVYTPTKNRVNLLLNRSVKSVLGQTYKNFEYLVIGDYCTDATEKEIKQIKDTRIKFYDLRDEKIHYEKLTDLKKIWCRGGAVPSNFALKISKGEWIARCDDDEEWTPEFLEKSINYALEHNLEFVSSDSIYSEAYIKKNGVEKLNPRELYSDYFQTSKFKKKNKNSFVGAPSTWVMRSYLKLFRFNEDSWRKKWNQVTDIDLLYRLAYCGVKCGYLDQKLVYQIPRNDNADIGWKAAMNDYNQFIEN